MEILKGAGVPKGSFYYFFSSKDAFGEALLSEYFRAYHEDMDVLFSKHGLSMAEKLMVYWAGWREHQLAFDFQGRCLAVKLGAEVSDLSEPMREALERGTSGVIARLSVAIEHGVAEGSVLTARPFRQVAESLYSLWLGASVMAKIERSGRPFDTALATTREMLGIVIGSALAA
ncbi:TetR family transcriptional regulator C-terminal domain-containing protein (plasmid) [Paraburkholderia sp. PREW-6R]|uniref:TetR family transcriptional regulator C-terminal domain-containing protein n=1 Tax=Paraburkholderia sp. PREW-6R TaxID=3141544 RepID=UPI0031F513A1